MRANKKLKKFGFSGRGGYYVDYDEDNNKVTREIDVIGHGKQQHIKTTVENFTLLFRPKIIAECKHVENSAMLIFEIPDEDKGNILVRFPIFTNGELLNNHIQARTMGLDSFYEFFDMRSISGKIVDVKVESDKFTRVKSKKDTLFDACEQLMPALSFYYERYLSFVRTDMGNLWHSHFERDYERIKNEQTENGIRGDALLSGSNHVFLESFKVDALRGGHFSIHCFFPIVLLDDDVALLRVVSDAGGEYSIKNLEEIPFCIYLHTPATSDKYTNILGNQYSLPILVCNIKHMDECMEVLRKGIDNLREEIEKNIENNPRCLGDEILLAHILNPQSSLRY